MKRKSPNVLYIGDVVDWSSSSSENAKRIEVEIESFARIGGNDVIMVTAQPTHHSVPVYFSEIRR
jgi:hypothetical protein